MSRDAGARQGGSVSAAPAMRADGCGTLGSQARSAAFPLALQDGEVVLKEGPAALARQEEAVETGWERLLRALRSYSSVHAGHLYLTARRMVFAPSQQRDQALTLDFPVSSIESAHVCSIAIRRGLALSLERGVRYYFLVRRPDEWMAVLSEVADLAPGPDGRPPTGLPS